jgi:hypothetical protein
VGTDGPASGLFSQTLQTPKPKEERVQQREKNMHFCPGEKYALLVRRKICTFGPTKNMHFWSGEKYALLVRRKVCTFGPAKNMHFCPGEKYPFLVG